MDIRILQMNMKYVMSASSVIILKNFTSPYFVVKTEQTQKCFKVSQSSSPEHTSIWFYLQFL